MHLSQILQCLGIWSMGEHEVQKHFANLIYLLRPRSHRQIVFKGVETGSNELCPAAIFYLYRANSASPIKCGF